MEISALYEIYKQYPSVQTDTRKLRDGDIFFALKGPNFNGNIFAAQALQAGAAYAVIDEAEYQTGERTILVPDVLTALQQLAKHHREQFNIPFIAITGSNGKTTTKELITTVLKEKFKTYATEGNLNNHIGVPLTLLKTKPDAEMAVIEMGANHQKEIESYCKIAIPTHALITNCGKAHIEGFGGEEGVRKGKGELYDSIRNTGGTIFRNTDLAYLEDMAKGINHQITYGSANAQYIGRPIMDDVMLQVAILSKGAETLIPTNLVGNYNFPNVMAAVAIGLHFDISIDKIKEAIAHYNPDNSRSQWLQTGSNKIILDAYNANPTSMRAAITNFAVADLDNKILWIGGMKEMGTDEEKEHRELVQLIAEYNWKDVILVGKEFNTVAGTYRQFETSVDAAAYVKQHRPEQSAILIKGSRGSKMENLLEALKSS
ncbi:MAG: UDP-N-acetylmuramoyl-tripeptide--D-alanyl-D-alanine ligase [Sphingobacteriales bacterium]|nr:MAG: UDP-N-acetylmuramoyl-tripeptide--D-alanyl-D-alanine ligase [Sphingobacteriales bacterium]